MRVVLATDRADLARALSLFLSEQRVQVLDVVDDAGALRSCASVERPDVALVDWRLGEDVTAAMVALLSEGEDPTPVVILTPAHQRRRARASGAAACASLGDAPETLLATLMTLRSVAGADDRPTAG
ncbi:MAG TPA: hypothetical protein VK576_01820 [Thermoleophilia bacterium]|nr:hypothetical protein [Thermoleophilia bacterium]